MGLLHNGALFGSSGLEGKQEGGFHERHWHAVKLENALHLNCTFTVLLLCAIVFAWVFLDCVDLFFLGLCSLCFPVKYIETCIVTTDKIIAMG